MPRTQVPCPNCRQTLTAEMNQIYDLNKDPLAKQKLLSGVSNLISCNSCGYKGSLGSPLIYHDPDKELLITFVPPELNLLRDDQEKVIGSLINQIMSTLTTEERKGYLLNPKSSLTYQGFIETILEADGITREMIKEQEDRVELIQQMLMVDEDKLTELVNENDSNVDDTLFKLLQRLIDSSERSNDEEGINKLKDLQATLMESTSRGKELASQAKEVEEAIQVLKDAGETLDRDKLIEIILDTKGEIKLKTIVSLTRGGLDYIFFQKLSEKIELVSGEEQERLKDLRQRLLDLIDEIDKKVEEAVLSARNLLNELENSSNIKNSILRNPGKIDDIFIQELGSAIQLSEKSEDQERLNKLNEISSIIQELTALPPDVALIQKLIEAEDEESRRTILENHPDMITSEFLEALSAVVAQVDSSKDENLKNRIRAVHRLALRHSMKMNLGKS